MNSKILSIVKGKLYYILFKFDSPLPPRFLCIAEAESAKRIEELIAKEWERLLEEHSRIGWVHIRGDGVHIWARDTAIINGKFKWLLC